jgi:hypothetical protein
VTAPVYPLYDPRALRAIGVGVAMVLLYASRFTKGAVRSIPGGLKFRLKPMVAWARAIGLPAYILFFGYFAFARQHDVPWWFGSLLMLAIAFAVATMPATIELTPTGITQRFWLRRLRSIAYDEVMAVQLKSRGRSIRVLGDNGVTITHSVNHCAAQEFVTEIERRTGKQLAT